MRQAWTNSRLAQREEFGPGEARGGGPGDEADRQRDGGDVGAEHRDQHEQQQEGGERLERLGDAHQHVVDPAAEIAGEGTDQDADADGDGGRDAADQQGDAGAVEDLGGDVAAARVGAEREARVGAGPLQGAAGQAQGVLRIKQRREEGGGEDDDHQHQADDCGGAADEPLEQAHRLVAMRGSSLA